MFSLQLSEYFSYPFSVIQAFSLYRQSFNGLSRSVWLLSLVMFINRCGTMVLPFLTLYLTQKLHFSVADAGIVMGVYGSGALLGTFLGGKLSDRIGFYRIQVAALLLAGVFLLILMHLTSFWAICAGVFCFTTLGDSFRPANAAAIAFFSTAENRTRAYSLNRLAINLGWSIGGGLGGFLAAIDYEWLFWADGITCILAGIALSILIKDPHSQKPAKNQENLHHEPLASPYRDRKYLRFAFFTTLFAISFFQLFSMEPLYFKQVHHISEAGIGAMMTINGLMIACMEMILVTQLEKRLHKLSIIGYGMILTTASFLVFNIWEGVWVVWLSIILNTLGEMFAMPFMQSVAVERSNEQNRGQYLALYSMCYSIAQISAPTIGSQIVQHFSFTILWYVMAGFCMTSYVGFRFLKRRF
ncbi:Predicted arabinose efflux permease, MFS family [Pseudarcicella hirudinis]|uniref:Predicted arabinose efflux permease, MFS family n=1 Tax=Pseudarcicella hirudinis TaxID=1079859 RepID=A0A1I5XC60_9BACT|nr:MFS transporter [Pseudarcicella hirudinis]SFQ29237.1 Predicted arabinose efflux permease, MFS family [Pseudarcicella hirudinis]